MKFTGKIVLIAGLFLGACQTTTSSNSNVSTPVPSQSKNSANSAISAFVDACVKTASNPNAAPETLESLGFRKTGVRKGTMQFASSYATATVAPHTSGGSLGQCTVTPKSGSFSNVVAVLGLEISNSGVQAMPLGGEHAWIIGNTGSIVFVARTNSVMARTQPGVIRR